MGAVGTGPRAALLLSLAARTTPGLTQAEEQQKKPAMGGGPTGPQGVLHCGQGHGLWATVPPMRLPDPQQARRALAEAPGHRQRRLCHGPCS